MNQKTKYRLLEIIPGATLWLTFAAAIFLSFIKPLWVIYFIILYDLYWLIRITYFVTYLFISWKRYRQINKINWFEKVKELSDANKLALKRQQVGLEISNSNRTCSGFKANSFASESDWQRYYHLIIMPTYRENYKVLRSTVEGLSNVDYDTQRLIVVFSRECGERAGEKYEEEFLQAMQQLKEEFGNKFYKLLGYIHPLPPANQLPGKGSNASWAVKKIQREFIDEQNIPYENIIVSNFDSDTYVYPQYFSRLMYLWLTADNPHRHSYQPLALYNNNIWDAPSFARVVANSTSFWLMAEKARPERMFTFSSHSMSFKTLVEVGYWETKIVTEDSRIFLQCFEHFDGNYSVLPMYVPISMDTVMGNNLWQTIKAQYRQMRRWAWSVEHFPWMITRFFGHKKICWSKKIRYLFNQSEGQFSWATGPMFIFVLGRLPLAVAAAKGLETAVVQNTPFVLEFLMSLAMIGVVVSAFVNIYFLPVRPSSKKRYKWILMITQWILLPITMVVFGSLPATDAQTRLMLGGRFRLGFDVTQKHRR